MEFLLSNIPPVRLAKKRSTIFCFDDLMSDADGLKIASGYISADALIELKGIMEVNKKSFLELVIGMHHYDGFTQPQFEAAKYLNEYLRTNNAGAVKVVTAFKFHGKIYSFLKQKTPFAGILGSSNLSNVLDEQNTYETDLYLNESSIVNEIDSLITRLSETASVSLDTYEPKIVEGVNKLLEGHDGVDRVSKEDLQLVLTQKKPLSFTIPLKGAEEAPQSNLNVFFGKGRENRKGFVKPRPWYEIEIIVPRSISNLQGYPQEDQVLTIYTDDGWKFKCKRTGDYGKNLRSEGDLKIFGRWIKGRIENKGSLKAGDRVTENTFKHYGRDNFELIATNNPDVWIADFKAK